jgi:ABC-type cobalamin/Fe3+-siderophores transport system ATPase subunit
LADFDLSTKAGELVVVLGGNGSGKTTLLRCISRMLSPTTGDIWLNDTNLATLSGAGFDYRRLRQGRHHPARNAARFSKIGMVWWPALETVDLGILAS